MLDSAFLGKTDLFRGVSSAHVLALQVVGRSFSFRAGDYLFRQGDNIDTIFVITGGCVELRIGLSVLGVNKEVAIEQLGIGKTLAWSAMVEPHTLTMSAYSATAADLVGFLRGDLRRLFAEHTDLGYLVMSNLLGVVGGRLNVTKGLWLRELQREVSARYR